MTVPARTWGPDGRQGAVSITFDNLGEARDVGAGTWPEGLAFGAHPSAVRALPRILSALGDLDVTASFFVEGWNLDVYTEQLSEIVGSGHDLGLHGWVHESWGSLAASVQASLLDRSVDAARRHEIALVGFRPPGGIATAETLKLLAERDLRFCSALAGDVGCIDDVVILPFEWRVVDGYHVLDELAALRSAQGDQATSATPGECAAAMRHAIDEVISDGGYAAITFHPFITADDAAHRATVRLIGEVASNPDVWCAPCSEVAAWIRTHPDSFGVAPALGTTTWN